MNYFKKYLDNLTDYDKVWIHGFICGLILGANIASVIYWFTT